MTASGPGRDRDWFWESLIAAPSCPGAGRASSPAETRSVGKRRFPARGPLGAGPSVASPAQSCFDPCPRLRYEARVAIGGRLLTRFILGIFGSFFTLLTLGAFMAALTVGAIFWMYSRDLPSHEQLANYQPPTISRVYSARGQLMDEFAKERRIFTAIDEIPDLVKHAFVSAEDKNFYTHHGYDPLGILKAALDADEEAEFAEMIRRWEEGQDAKADATSAHWGHD